MIASMMPGSAVAGAVVPHAHSSCGPGKTAVAGAVAPYAYSNYGPGKTAVLGVAALYANASCEPGKTAVAFAGRAAEWRLSVTGAAVWSRSRGSGSAAACSCWNGEPYRYGVLS